jgi:hypothetical protein
VHVHPHAPSFRAFSGALIACTIPVHQRQLSAAAAPMHVHTHGKRVRVHPAMLICNRKGTQ